MNQPKYFRPVLISVRFCFTWCWILFGFTLVRKQSSIPTDRSRHLKLTNQTAKMNSKPRIGRLGVWSFLLASSSSYNLKQNNKRPAVTWNGIQSIIDFAMNQYSLPADIRQSSNDTNNKSPIRMHRLTTGTN